MRNKTITILSRFREVVAIRELNVNVLFEAIDRHLNIETPLSPFLSHCHKSNIGKFFLLQLSPVMCIIFIMIMIIIIFIFIISYYYNIHYYYYYSYYHSLTGPQDCH